VGQSRGRRECRNGRAEGNVEKKARQCGEQGKKRGRGRIGAKAERVSGRTPRLAGDDECGRDNW
jgi:hypothetical protein